MFASNRVVSALALRALILARRAEALVGAKAPELMDFREPRAPVLMAPGGPLGGCTKLWRRVRVLEEAAVNPVFVVFWPFRRETSLFRRDPAPRVRSEILLS